MGSHNLKRSLGLLVLVVYGAQMLSAQSAPEQEGSPVDAVAQPLQTLVWRYLREPKESKARDQLKVIAQREDFDYESLISALDTPPIPDLPFTGTKRQIPWQIPGTSVSTNYTLHIPAGLSKGKLHPLWIAIHGTGGTGESAWYGVNAALAEYKAIVVAPSEASDFRGKGWGYRHRERVLHTGLLDELLRTLPIDSDRVFIGGVSRGGHASFDLAMRYSDRIAGALPVIGSVLQRDLSLLGNLHSLPVVAMNGAQDQPSLVEGAKLAMKRLSALSYPARFVLDPERGHSMFSDRYGEVLPGLMAGRRPRMPKKLSFHVRDLAYSRHYWLRADKFLRTAYRPGRPLKLKGSSKMSDQEKRVAVRRLIEKTTPSFEAEIKDNGVVSIRTQHVSKFTVALPYRWVEPGQRVVIEVNGRRRYNKPWRRSANARHMLKLARSWGRGDPSFQFADAMTFTVR